MAVVDHNSMVTIQFASYSLTAEESVAKEQEILEGNRGCEGFWDTPGELDSPLLCPSRALGAHAVLLKPLNPRPTFRAHLPTPTPTPTSSDALPMDDSFDPLTLPS